MEDRTIQNAVLEELDWDPSLDAAGIGVTVKEGVVTLTGDVTSYLHKHNAEEVANRVRGVRAVANDLEVRIESPFGRSDSQGRFSCGDPRLLRHHGYRHRQWTGIHHH